MYLWHLAFMCSRVLAQHWRFHLLPHSRRELRRSSVGHGFLHEILPWRAALQVGLLINHSINFHLDQVRQGPQGRRRVGSLRRHALRDHPCPLARMEQLDLNGVGCEAATLAFKMEIACLEPQTHAHTHASKVLNSAAARARMHSTVLNHMRAHALPQEPIPAHANPLTCIHTGR